jgi:hypothetical protein
MEHRHDLEQILLNGLPEDERRQTIDSITEATAARLAHLRSTTADGETSAGLDLLPNAGSTPRSFDGATVVPRPRS